MDVWTSSDEDETQTSNIQSLMSQGTNFSAILVSERQRVNLLILSQALFSHQYMLFEAWPRFHHRTGSPVILPSVEGVQIWLESIYHLIPSAYLENHKDSILSSE